MKEKPPKPPQTVQRPSRARAYPPSRLIGLRPPWRPGESGNPDGVRKAIAEARRLAQQHSLFGIQRLIELAADEDSRVSTIAVQTLLGYGIGKPVEAPAEESREPLPIDVKKLSPERRMQLREIINEYMARADGPPAENAPVDAEFHDVKEPTND
jgi:hypothetical protein